LDDDAAWVGHLEEALFPVLGFDRRRELDARLLEALVFGVDVVDFEDDHQAVGAAAGERCRLERR
jgi:hypothetical protein